MRCATCPRVRRRALLAALAPATREALDALLAYRTGTAGGIMTTALATLRERDTVADAIELLRELEAHRVDIDAVLVVSDEGRLVDDISLFELLVARSRRRASATSSVSRGQRQSARTPR